MSKDSAGVPADSSSVSQNRMSGPAWNDDRRRRQADLAACRPALGELYETAVDLLGNTTAPGRIPLLAHCMREIGNRLPDALGAELPDRANYDKAMAALATWWLDAGMPVSPLDGTDDDANPAVRLSPAVAAAVMDVVVKYGLGAVSNQARATYLARGGLPLEFSKAIQDYSSGQSNPAQLLDHAQAHRDPSVRALLQTHDFFQGYAHIGTKDREPPAETELSDRVRHYELAIDSRIGGWWELYDDLHDLLETINDETGRASVDDGAPDSEGDRSDG